MLRTPDEVVQGRIRQDEPFVPAVRRMVGVVTSAGCTHLRTTWWSEASILIVEGWKVSEDGVPLVLPVVP